MGRRYQIVDFKQWRIKDGWIEDQVLTRKGPGVKNDCFFSETLAFFAESPELFLAKELHL